MKRQLFSVTFSYIPEYLTTITYRFVLFITTTDQWPKKDIGVQAGVRADVLLVPSVLLVYLECLCPLVCVITTNILPMSDIVQIQ